MIFSVFFLIGFLGILGTPYCGIGATIRIGREMLCLPYAGFLVATFATVKITLSSLCKFHNTQILPQYFVSVDLRYFPNFPMLGIGADVFCVQLFPHTKARGHKEVVRIYA